MIIYFPLKSVNVFSLKSTPVKVKSFTGVPTAGNLPTVCMALPPNVMVVPLVCAKQLAARQTPMRTVNSSFAENAVLFLMFM